MSENEFLITCWQDHPEILFDEEKYIVIDFDMENKSVLVMDEGKETFWLAAKLIEIV